MKSRSGQASLLLIILSAIAIIFFAISLNWGRISQIKVLTTVAATTTASQAASNYASYGELLQKEQLGGSFDKCGHNSIFGAILTLIVVIVIVIAQCYLSACAGANATIGSYLSYAATSAAVLLATASVVLQVSVVQPGLTRMWNSLQQEANLSTTEQFLDNALQNAVQNASSDSAMITDYFDYNSNGKFGFNTDKKIPDDVLSRYSFFMTEHERVLKSKKQNIDLSVFRTGLAAFINKITKPGLIQHDPRYNKCCLPLKDLNGRNLRPNVTVCPDRDVLPAECVSNTVWPYGSKYPLSYDPTRPDYSMKDSFLSQFGIDEEVRDFSASLDNKVNTEAVGLFKGLWYMQEIRKSLSVDPAGYDFAPAPVDTHVPPRQMDKVDAIDKFKAPDNFCPDANPPMGDSSPEAGLNWKPGKDSYCQSTWPYDDCDKYKCANATSSAGGDCCTPADATRGVWPEDLLDDTVDQLKIFYTWGKGMLAKYPAELSQGLESWYDNGAGTSGKYWLGPKCNGKNKTICADQGYRNGEDGGVLYTIKRRLAAWDAKIKPWLNDNNFADDASWCVPSDASGLSTAESGAISSGTWGSLPNVVKCLDYYGNGAAYAAFNNCQIKINAIKDQASKADKYAKCKTYFDQRVSDAAKAGLYAVCQKDLDNASVAEKYLNCQKAIAAGYCKANPPTSPPAACSGFTRQTSSPPIFDSCTGGSLYSTWVSSNIAFFGTPLSTFCGSASPPSSCADLPSPSSGGSAQPAFDACSGSNFSNWLIAQQAAFGGTWGQFCAGGTTAALTPTVCNALPASTIAGAVPDACGDPSGYATWLLNSQNSFNGGQTKASFCANPVLPAECSESTSLPRSLAQKKWNHFDICDDDAKWNVIDSPYIPDSYQDWIDKSMSDNLLYQQGDQSPLAPTKFKKRYNYLKNLLDSMQQGESAISSFSQDLTDFLNGPVLSLTNARDSLNSVQLDSIPNTIIYGWHDENPPPGQNREGYWHVVQATVVAPPKLPSVGTYTKGFLGSTRCYFLQDYTDKVQVTIKRWDEDHDQSNFANKLPIWKVSFRKPGSADVTNPSATCIGNSWLKLGLSLSPDTYGQLSAVWGADTKTQELLKGAFMITGQPDISDPAWACYNRMVNDLLPSGVESKVCAWYDKDAKTTGLGVHFGACP